MDLEGDGEDADQASSSRQIKPGRDKRCKALRGHQGCKWPDITFFRQVEVRVVCGGQSRYDTTQSRTDNEPGTVHLAGPSGEGGKGLDARCVRKCGATP
jgi:hypothetical protein